MKKIKAYYKNSDIIKFERKVYKNGDWIESTFNRLGQTTSFKKSDGFWSEITYNDNGDQITLRNSLDMFRINEADVTKGDFNKYLKSTKVNK